MEVSLDVSMSFFPRAGAGTTTTTTTTSKVNVISFNDYKYYMYVHNT